MRSDDPNLPHPLVIADALGELCEQVVFLGGAVVGLLVSDPLADSVRATYDVDAVVDLEWSRFRGIEQRVEAQSFTREMHSGVLCRWVHGASGVIFDLMPADVGVLGFSNRWYTHAVETAQAVALSDLLSIRWVTATTFVATKLEAFTTREGEATFFPVTTWRTYSTLLTAGLNWWKSSLQSMQIFAVGSPMCSQRCWTTRLL